MSKTDNFDEWFKKTYPEYCYGDSMLEPYYGIASYAWECAEQTLEVELKSEIGCETCTKFDEVKLTKAKELLKRCYENYIYLEPLRSEIEQFLKENK